MEDSSIIPIIIMLCFVACLLSMLFGSYLQTHEDQKNQIRECYNLLTNDLSIPKETAAFKCDPKWRQNKEN